MMERFICNSFQVPNAVVDQLMADMSGVALKCYMLITRKTTGWGKTSDKISVNQFIEFSGVKDKRTIYCAINELENLGLIRSEKKQGVITEFCLVTQFELDTENAGTKNATSDKKCNGVGTKNVPTTSDKKCTPTKDTIKNTITKNNNKKLNKKDLDLSGFKQQPSERVWFDYLEHRKHRRAPLTQSALNTIIKHVNICIDRGLSTDEVLSTCMSRGWTGFESDWVIKDLPKKEPTKSFSENDYGEAKMPNWARG